MKLYRYMSKTELDDIISGKTLVHNLKEHIARTNSRGFCFLPEIVKFKANNGKMYEFTPEKCFEFLYGVVYPDVLVEFEVLDEVLFKGYGTYADPTNDIFGDLIDIEEYSLMEYNKDILCPVRIKMSKEDVYDFVGSEWEVLKN